MADPTPAPLGTMIRYRRRASRRARQACKGAPPPKAIMVHWPNILAALDGMDARRIRHVLLDDLGDAGRRPDAVKPERRADIAACSACSAPASSSAILPPAK